MRRFLPETLPAWVLLILIAGLLVTQVTTLTIVSRDRRSSAEILELYRLNDRALSLVKLLAPASPAERGRLAAGLTNPVFPVDVSSEPLIDTSIPPDDTFAEMEDILVDRLAQYAVADARIRRDLPDDAVKRRAARIDGNMGDVQRGLVRVARRFAHTDRLTAAIRFKDGQWLNFSMPMTPLGPVLTVQSAALYIAIALVVVALSIWALRRLTAPYRMLEAAVWRLGRDLKGPPLPEAGSREYRSAAHALNSMQAQLREYVEDREHLAAALAHDLRTPLTRMRLRLELVDDPAVRDPLMNALGEIDAIAGSVIDFARMQYGEEEPEPVDMWSLVAALADGYPQIAFDPPETARGLVCRARPTALRRCIDNLFGNAVAYGGSASVSLSLEGGTIVLVVADSGPGIPEAQLEAVMRPFVRVDSSRNRNTGGSGLGLTIASTFAREMGGSLILRNGEDGGLRAELRLPAAGTEQAGPSEPA